LFNPAHHLLLTIHFIDKKAIPASFNLQGLYEQATEQSIEIKWLLLISYTK